MMFDMIPRLMFMGVGMLIVTAVLLTFLFAVVVVLKSLASNNRRDVVVDDYDEYKRKHDAPGNYYDLYDEELHQAEIIEEDQYQSDA
jgi:hypothetical protein